MAWIDWESESTRKLWFTVLDELEGGLRKFAGRNLPDTHWEVERTGWDAADVALAWSSGGLDRNVHLILHGHDWPLRIEYEGAAWQDDAEAREVRAWSAKPSERTVTVENIDAVKQSLDRDLPAAVEQIQRLSLAQTRAHFAD